ncbi:universal stress protein [Flavisolibacter ginsengisoli]|jgi:nucleotide-binding universal stress UspA family protein|uniref:Nucleotide-binding universal stress protein, UspA family n=1 Tax=Flavisolibacter ginsengisoli DSM 18119 TaxID=1121884 RepID=A0A1M4UFV4_9BACT|nr:universal stress protein [Flavisolibacter ginsengisoli]SHE55544.1 Nucleotide-binding universal stress protein, UspA family [Flavisolibacter ginsengisoli DSM 18119]
MKTLLVPIDFSDTSDNALEFAIHWSRTYNYGRIILLKSLYDSMFESIIVSAEYGNVSQDYKQMEREETIAALDKICHKVAALLPGVKIMTAVSEYPLIKSVIEIIEEEDVDLIILGSDHYSYSSDSYISGHVITIAKISPVRVLIVPAGYVYKPVKHALVPCNFNAIQWLEKINSLPRSSPWEEVILDVLNVDPGMRYVQPDEKFKSTEEKLHQILKNFPHQIFYTNETDIIQGILNFEAKQPIEIIIALPGKYSFLYALTHKSISEAIYRNATKPVLILK